MVTFKFLAGYGVLWNTASSEPGDGYWYPPLKWILDLESSDREETRNDYVTSITCK